MCVSVVKKVIRISSGTAVMEDGRTVYLGGLGAIVPGDYLEVYANLAIAKVPVSHAQSIYSVRKGGRRS